MAEQKLHKQHSNLSNAIAYILLVILSIIWLFPFVCIVLQSFRAPTEGGGGMVAYLVPKTFSLDSYRWLFSADSNFVKWFGNTFIIAFFIALGQTCFVLMVSYALSRTRFAGTKRQQQGSRTWRYYVYRCG